MRRTALMLILLGSQAGCLWTTEMPQSAWMRRFHNQAVTPENVLIEVAVLEQPPGESYINHALWQHTDEMIVPLERRGLFADNGLRVGQIVGASPAGFQQLLLSERWTKANRMTFPAGHTKTLFLTSTTLPQMAYAFIDGKKTTEMNLDQARFGFDVEARFATDGRTILRFTPTIEHGDLAFPFKPSPERQAWEMKLQRPSQRYPELSWEVTLGPNQYVLVGGRPEREGSLGHAGFVHHDGTTAVQRLLAIRNIRPMRVTDEITNHIEERLDDHRPLPLAHQAAMPVSRSKSR